MPDKSDLLKLKKQLKKYRRDALFRAARSLICYVCLFIHHMILLFMPLMTIGLWSLKETKSPFIEAIRIILMFFVLGGFVWNVAYLLNDTNYHFEDRKTKYDEICGEILTYNQNIKRINKLIKKKE